MFAFQTIVCSYCLNVLPTMLFCGMVDQRHSFQGFPLQIWMEHSSSSMQRRSSCQQREGSMTWQPWLLSPTVCCLESCKKKTKPPLHYVPVVGPVCLQMCSFAFPECHMFYSIKLETCHFGTKQTLFSTFPVEEGNWLFLECTESCL